MRSLRLLMLILRRVSRVCKRSCERCLRRVRSLCNCSWAAVLLLRWCVCGRSPVAFFRAPARSLHFAGEALRGGAFRQIAAVQSRTAPAR